MNRLVLLTALTLCTALPVYTAQAQGYSGLFAPAPEEQQTAPKAHPATDAPAAAAAAAEVPVANPVAPAPKRAATQGEATYSGLVAPPKNTPKTSTPKQNAAARDADSYAGLVSAAPKPAPAAVNMSRAPARPVSRPDRNIYIDGSKPVMNTSDLRIAAIFNRLRDNSAPVKPHAVSGQTVDDILKLKSTDKVANSGTLGATERRVDKTIRRWNKEVNDPRLTPQERKARAQAAYQELLRDNDGLIALSKATTPIYTRFGLSESSAENMASDESKALTKVQAAIRQFDQIRK